MSIETDQFASMRIRQLQRVDERMEKIGQIINFDAHMFGKRETHVVMPKEHTEEDQAFTYSLKIDDQFLFGMHLVKRSMLMDLIPFAEEEERR